MLAQNGLPGPEALALMPRSRSRRGRVQARQGTSPAATTMRPTTPKGPDWTHWYMRKVLKTWPTCTWTEDALQAYRSQPTGTDASDPLRLWSKATATANAPLAEREATAASFSPPAPLAERDALRSRMAVMELQSLAPYGW